jgi:hypothetical protein
VRRVVTRLTQAFPGPLRTGKGVVLRDLGPEKFHLCRRKWCGCATRTPPLRVFPRDTLDFCSRQPLRTISFARGVIVGYLLGHLRTDECGSEGQSRGVGSHVRVDAEVNRFGQKLYTKIFLSKRAQLNSHLHLSPAATLPRPTPNRFLWGNRRIVCEIRTFVLSPFCKAWPTMFYQKMITPPIGAMTSTFRVEHYNLCLNLLVTVAYSRTKVQGQLQLISENNLN